MKKGTGWTAAGQILSTGKSDYLVYFTGLVYTVFYEEMKTKGQKRKERKTKNAENKCTEWKTNNDSFGMLFVSLTELCDKCGGAGE